MYGRSTAAPHVRKIASAPTLGFSFPFDFQLSPVNLFLFLFLFLFIVASLRLYFITSPSVLTVPPRHTPPPHCPTPHTANYPCSILHSTTVRPAIRLRPPGQLSKQRTY